MRLRSPSVTNSTDLAYIFRGFIEPGRRSRPSRLRRVTPVGTPMVDAYPRALAYLWGLQRLGAQPGLEVIGSLLKGLGHPERTFPSIHVTGSKGKGSVAMFCASVLSSAGERTGLFSSPHLLSYRERIQVDGRPISRADTVRGIQMVRRVAGKLLRDGQLPREPTFFEVTTALAFHHFREKKVTAAVVEVGIGGRLDATNTIQAPVTVITTLELEHTDILGPTLRDIAHEKSGIFHKGAWGVVGDCPGEGLEEVRRNAFHLGVPLWQWGRDVVLERRELGPQGQTVDVRTPVRFHPGLEFPLLGPFQAHNAALAVAALDLYGRSRGTPVPEEAFREGFQKARWPGRLERLSSDPPFYVDAAHTPHSAQELVKALQELHPGIPRTENVVLFGCLRDKKVEAILDELSTLADTLVVTPLRSPRSMPPTEILRAGRGRFHRILSADGLSQGIALGRAGLGPTGILLATGGVYLAGEVLSAHLGIPPEEPSLSDPLGMPASPDTASDLRPRTRSARA